MNTRILVLALATAFSTAAALPALAAEQHAHGHGAHAEATQKLTLNNGQKWKTDAPLRKGMEEIRNALEQAHGQGEASPATYVELGKKMESQIASIVMNCKLEPAADANLHVIIGELNAAADAFRGANPADAEEAMQRATRAVGDYDRYFDHPGFAKSKRVSDSRAPLDLQGAVGLISRTYPGRVVAAQADPAAHHYHVDLLLPHGSVVRFDVDPDSHGIDNHRPDNRDPRMS